MKAADKAKEEMASLNADNERILQKARVERDALLKEARGIKKSIINEAKKQANTEAEKILSFNFTICFSYTVRKWFCFFKPIN